MKKMIERYPATFGAMIVAGIAVVIYFVLIGVGEAGVRILQLFVTETLRPEGTPLLDCFVVSPMLGFLIITLGAYFGKIAIKVLSFLTWILAKNVRVIVAGCRSLGLRLAHRCGDGSADA